MSMEEITADTGIAQLARNHAEEGMTISGVAIGEDETTSHASGDKFWSAEQLMAGAKSLVGTQLTKNHNHDVIEGVIGEVTDATYKDGVGVLFEAEVYDEEVANKIERGLLEVSIHAVHSNGGFTDDGEMIVENIEFRDLSVVPRGAAQSNQVSVGSLQPATLSEDLSAICDDAFAGSYQGATIATAQEFGIKLAEMEDLEDGVLVSWQSSGGEAYGQVVDTITEGEYDGEIDGDVVVGAPAALIQVWNDDGEDWEATDTMVAHKPETLTVIDELPALNSSDSTAETHTEELDEVYADFNDTVNMTAGQLRSWSENPCSREASVRPTFVIRRNLRLLSRSKEDWTRNDVSDAKRTISFVERMSAQRPDNPRQGPAEGCPSKWAISLMNWAFNPFDSMPSMPEGMEPADEITLESDYMVDTRKVEEELADLHEVSYEGIEEDDWSAPNLEDFPDEYFDADGNAKFDLVDDHFLYSESQFPPENYTDLKFPVVSPDGMLNLSALRAAKSRAPQADIPVDEQEEIQNIVNELVMEAFDMDWTDNSAEESDDGSYGDESQSFLAENETSNTSDTMTEQETVNGVDVEALQNRVEELEEQNESLQSEVEAVRQEYADALCGDSAFSAEELADKFTVEELAEKYEEADFEIAEASAPDPQTGGMEEAEAGADESQDSEVEEEVALLEEQIAQYERMGWDGAKDGAESRLAELRDEDAE